jgi:glycosyltransferase involved in cell wall biosynthesis
MACSLPVIAYNVKGPKDIIQHGINGFLVKNIDEMKENINRYIANKDSWHNYKKMALLRAAEYNKTKILNQLLKDTGFDILINE